MKFFDTNILLYAAIDHDHDKHAIAAGLIRDALVEDNGAISAQVVNEFTNVMFKKTKRTSENIRQLLATFSPMLRVDTTSSLVDEAIESKTRHGIQYFDALIIVAAKRSGCDTIISEDMQNGRSYDGVKCVNPFA